MQGRLSEVEGRIALLEVELAGLKGEAGELRSRRASAAQHHHHRLDAIRSGKPASGASAAEVAAAVQGGLAALEGLAGAVRGGGGEPTAAGDGGAAADAAALSQQVSQQEVCRRCPSRRASPAIPGCPFPRLHGPFPACCLFAQPPALSPCTSPYALPTLLPSRWWRRRCL